MELQLKMIYSFSCSIRTKNDIVCFLNHIFSKSCKVVKYERPSKFWNI